MQDHGSIWQFIMAAVVTAAAYFFGGWDAVLMALVTLVALDYITGLMSAYVNKSLSSEIGQKGILKKIGIFLAVGLAHVVDRTGLAGEPILRTMSIVFFMGNEGLSILENLAEIGVPLPAGLRDALERLRGRDTDAPRVS